MNKSLIKRMKEERFSRVSIDLFSGPGGLCTGFKWAGILPLVAVEWTDTTVETYSVTHNAEVFELFEQVLSAYKDQLEKWVLGGIGGEGDPKTQWASHIITVNDKETECNVCSIDEYIIECQQRGIEGQLGTPFQWTYPSGGKGKRIQLKGKMI
ncbi:MAG: MspI family type II restriction endonuclease [Lachnospiraceae bacterium]|nr:MspI family type II restriction endonuclease [Lachnospiraceae bacterium]